MPRPRICRRIFFNPHVTHFKPEGILLKDIKISILTHDELEAIRLIAFEKISQNKVAKEMRISQPTLSRLLTSARKKLADAIVNGKSIKIEGGDFKMVQSKGRGVGLGKGQGFGVGLRGRMGGVGAGPGGKCVCPNCGYEELQIRGQPCLSKKCPKCGTKMVRE
jgi:uncharacterized protein